jgi:hypothetical protein
MSEPGQTPPSVGGTNVSGAVSVPGESVFGPSVPGVSVPGVSLFTSLLLVSPPPPVSVTVPSVPLPVSSVTEES